jgi:hypothetical protein
MLTEPRVGLARAQSGQRWRVSNRSYRGPRQQRRSGVEGAQEEDAARRRLPGNEGTHRLREAVRGQGAPQGRISPPCAETGPQTRPARRPSAETGRHPDLDPDRRLAARTIRADLLRTRVRSVGEAADQPVPPPRIPLRTPPSAPRPPRASGSADRGRPVMSRPGWGQSHHRE